MAVPIFLISENKNIGTAKVELVFQGNYQGIIKTEFEIIQRDIDYVDISKIEDQCYTGLEIMPEFQLNHDATILVPDVDYTVTYEENVGIGKGKIVITGLGNYCESKVEEFTIVPRPIKKTEIVCEETFIYSGMANEPKPILTLNGNTLEEEVDYQLEYKDNIDVGKGTIIIKGLGNYCDETAITFDIFPKDISGITVDEILSQTYNGTALKPVINAWDGILALTSEKDYTLSYENNINVGSGSIIITGNGNYTGTKTVNFKIQPKSLQEVVLSPIKAKTYTGTVIKPNITIKDAGKDLVLNTDYKVKFSNNKKVGTAKVVVTGKGNYTGSLSSEFTIKQASMKKAKLIMAESVAYTGKAVKPSVKVFFGEKKLKAKRDYTVSYSKNIVMGKFGLSFSLKRALGITAVKQKVSKATGIPLTKQGLERKIGGALLNAVTGGKKKKSKRR